MGGSGAGRGEAEWSGKAVGGSGEGRMPECVWALWWGEKGWGGAGCGAGRLGVRLAGWVWGWVCRTNPSLTSRSRSRRSHTYTHTHWDDVWVCLGWG